MRLLEQKGKVENEISNLIAGNNFCELCLNPKRIGRDDFILENELGILVRNSIPILKLKNRTYIVKDRFSFAIKDHRAKIETIEEESIKAFISRYLYEKYRFKNGIDFAFYRTMNTIVDHWHIHACLLPFYPCSPFGTIS